MVTLSLIVFTPAIVTLAFCPIPTPQGDADATDESQNTEGIEVADFESAVFVAADIQNMVEAVFDAPFLAAGPQKSQGWEFVQGATGHQPHLRGIGRALHRADFVQASDLGGCEHAQFGRFNGAGDQTAPFVTAPVFLLSASGPLGLGLLIGRGKKNPARGFGRFCAVWLGCL